jgi:tRNA threonylcarbamoyladenosine biosynthesis protein TsaB
VTVLGIETSTTVCGAAVAVDGVLAAEASIALRNAHAERLLALVERAMADAAVTLKNIDGVAVSIGPGSFTGLRIGLSTAKGLVYAGGKALVGVPTLPALARRVASRGVAVAGEYVVPVLDARRGEVDCPLFVVEGGGVVPAGDASDLTMAALLEVLEDRVVVVTGEAVGTVREAAHTSRRLERVRYADSDTAQCSPGMIAVMGGEMLCSGMRDDPSTLEPRYIKEFFLKSR